MALTRSMIGSAHPKPSVAQQSQACEVCGNLYDKAFEVKLHDRVYTFDCFECAIHRLAPQCAHCNCRVIGHGIENDGVFYCCAHCARRSGEAAARDRVDGD